MIRRPSVLLVLLALAVAPSTASAATAPTTARWHHPGGGATAATIAQVPTDDPTGGAGAPVGDVADELADLPGVVEDLLGSGDGGARTPTPTPTPVPAAPVGTAPAPGPALLVPVPSTQRTVRGRVARLRTDGRAAIPRSAPKPVKRVLAAANLIAGKPYKWGGGHARLFDTGYDCSGAVSYALIRAGLLRSPMVSGGLARWATKGAGRWISIHANAGHVYMEVAGLRLDTSRVGDPGGRSGVRWRPAIGRRTGFGTRHIAGL